MQSKSDQVATLITAYRANTSQDGAFDALAAERLGISVGDLRCLDIIQRRGRLTAGELAAESGLTSGAITGVLDRLERAGLARRMRDPTDRRKVGVEVTERHYEESGRIWGPLMEDWQKLLTSRFTAAELATITDFLESATALGTRHTERIRRG